MPAEERTGQIVGHYRILRPLGYGGTATVFLAEDIHLQREIAIKVFQPKEIEASENTQDFLRRFAREARVLGQLDHPNILPVYEYGEQDNTAYLIMPRLPGGSLRDRLLVQPTVSASETVELMEQILKALQYSHERGLIHRDIKPGNILFKADGTPVLSDFGLVKILPIEDKLLADHETVTMTTHNISGTPEYMAPEQIRGQAVPASDLYAMGVVLYEMLTGTKPFKAENYIGILMKHVYEQPLPLRNINPHISPALEAVVLQALAKDASQRYRNPEEMRQALLRALHSDQNGQSNNLLPSSSSKEERSLSVPTPASPISANTYTTNLSAFPSDPPTRYEPYYQSASPPVAWSPEPQQQRSRTPLIVTLLLIILVLAISLGSLLYSKGLPAFLPGLAPKATSTQLIRPGSTTLSKGYPTSTTTTVPSGTTTIECPTANTARIAVMAPLALGNHQNIIYIVNEFDAAKKVLAGTLKRRDITNNSIKGVEILKMPGVLVTDAQVSNDGQWILFTASIGNHSELRLLRMDGTALQTLYCSTSDQQLYQSPQWSFDQQTIIFDTSPQVGKITTYTLNITTGQLQIILQPSKTSSMGFVPRTWIDNTHVILTGIIPNSDAPPQSISILDIKKGANQPESNLQVLLSATLSCTSFDTSYDSAQLFVSTCISATGSGPGLPGNPSTITVQPLNGGAAKTIFQSNDLAITTLRAINKNMLLLQVENSNGDRSKDGLWELQTDGTGLKRLSTDTEHAQMLCSFTQNAWANVSRDGSLFALQYYNYKTNNYRMYSGNLSQSTLGDPFADISDGTELSLVGWTLLP